MKSTEADNMGSVLSFSVDELEPSTAMGNATRLSSEATGAADEPTPTDADADLSWRDGPAAIVVPAIVAAIATAIDCALTESFFD